MKRFLEERRRIQQNLKGIRDDEIRRKARLLILVMEAKSVKEGCDKLGLVRNTVYDWLRRLRANDFDLKSLKNRSTRPHHSPNKTDAAIEKLVIEMHKEHGNSDRLLAILFAKRHGIKISHSTVCAILKRAGLSKKYRCIKPNSFNRRYSAKKPNDQAQADTLWTGLTDNNGNRVYMVGIIDDCSRYAFGELWDAKGGYEASETLRMRLEQLGLMHTMQTDNGVEFTYRFVSELHHARDKAARKAQFEQILEDYGIKHRLIKPRTPQHNGKIERFNKTVLREFSARVKDGLSLAEYRVLFKEFLSWSNNERPHSSLKYLTPSQVFFQEPEPQAA